MQGLSLPAGTNVRYTFRVYLGLVRFIMGYRLTRFVFCFIVVVVKLMSRIPETQR